MNLGSNIINQQPFLFLYIESEFLAQLIFYVVVIFLTFNTLDPGNWSYSVIYSSNFNENCSDFKLFHVCICVYKNILVYTVLFMSAFYRGPVFFARFVSAYKWRIKKAHIIVLKIYPVLQMNCIF